jgi:hypothetical protein
MGRPKLQERWPLNSGATNPSQTFERNAQGASARLRPQIINRGADQITPADFTAISLTPQERAFALFVQKMSSANLDFATKELETFISENRRDHPGSTALLSLNKSSSLPLGVIIAMHWHRHANAAKWGMRAVISNAYYVRRLEKKTPSTVSVPNMHYHSRYGKGSEQFNLYLTYFTDNYRSSSLFPSVFHDLGLRSILFNIWALIQHFEWKEQKKILTTTRASDLPGAPTRLKNSNTCWLF